MDVNEVTTNQAFAPDIQIADTENNVRQWIFERMKSFITGRVLEIADGDGFIAPVCMQQGIKVEVMEIDLENEEFDEKYRAVIENFDTLILMNKGQQLKQNKSIATNCARLLKQGGNFIIQVPARAALYCGLDEGFELWKIYNQAFINKLLRNQYQIIKLRYFIINQDFSDDLVSSSKFYQRVVKFSAKYSKIYIQSGLFILLVGKKR